MPQVSRAASPEPLASFGVCVRFDGGHPVLYISGEVDVCTAPELEALVFALLGRSHDEIVLDFGDMRFIDGRGLAVVARSAAELSAAGGQLVVRAPSLFTRRILELADLGDGVRVEPTLRPRDDVSALARAVQIPADRDVVRAALLLVVALAQTAVNGADRVTVSLAPHGALAAVVALDPEIAVLDRDQYDVGEGPCLDAAEFADRFHVRATATEHRWPKFVPLARDRGVNSILSTPLRAVAGAVGALNMYSYRDNAFSEGDEQTAELLARGAVDVLDRGGSDVSTAALESRVRDALATRHTIALAQGILIGRERLSAADAYTTLRRESQRTGRPLRDVAAVFAEWAEGGASDGSPAR